MQARRNSVRADAVRALLLVIVIAGGVPTAQGFRRDEVECEEAAAMLEDCCPGFEPGRINCTYVSSCSGNTYPSLAPAESECILGKSCDTLRSGSVCERAIARMTGAGADASVSSAAGEVCP